MKKKSILLFLTAMTAVGMYANDGVGTEPDDSLRQQQVNWQEDCGALSANKNDYAGLNALRSRMASDTPPMTAQVTTPSGCPLVSLSISISS